MAFKYEPGQILVDGGHSIHVTFFRVEGRTAAYVTTVELEEEFTPDAGQHAGFTKGTCLPGDRVSFGCQLGPRRNRIRVDADGNEYGGPSNTVWDGSPVPYSNC